MGAHASGGAHPCAHPDCTLSLAPPSAAGAGERLDQSGLNLDADVAAMSEKGLHELRSDLAQLDAEVSAELRRTLADNYQPFINASQVTAPRCLAPAACAYGLQLCRPERRVAISRVFGTNQKTGSYSMRLARV